MPPVARLEDYLELVAHRRGRRAEGLPVRIEGYPPPDDPRHGRAEGHARSRRDRGQCPAGRRPGARRSTITTGVYEDARACRLGADKFMIDGRHTGTGGGDHVVVGGASPADSPFLRRPDVLKSLLLYWQRHPSLSYLFSGLFVGPTSQAPRVDEARHDSLYELDIALSHDPPPGRGRAARALAGRPAAAQPAGRRRRQHPPHRDLHRQALFAGRPDRPAGPAGVPRLRDAAGRAHEPGPAAADPRPDRLVLARAAGAAAGALGHGPARPLHAAALRLERLPGRARRPEPRRLRLRSGTGTRRSGRSASPSTAGSQYGGVDAGAAPRAGALARDGRGERGRRHGALRRFLGRAAAGAGQRLQSGAPRHHLQRPRPADDADRASSMEAVAGRALQGLEAAQRPAPDPAGRCAADLRHHRPLERALAGRLRLSRRPPGRAQLRYLPGQLLRSAGAAQGAVRGARPHARAS